MRPALARALFAAAALAPAAAGLAGACNPAAYDDYVLTGSPGTGGQGSSCNGFYSNEASCQSCFAASSCCGYEAAQCDEDCKKFIACEGNCVEGDVAACKAACKERFSFEPGKIDNLLGCLADWCSQCTGLLSDSGAIGAPQAGGAGAGGGPGQRCLEANSCGNAACLDCDQDGSGSCETDSAVSRTNCGACGRTCLTTSCVDGQCLATSVASGVHVEKRLVSGGGFLYWVSTKQQIEGLKGDAIYYVDVANNGQPTRAYEPAGALTIFDLAADDADVYFVTNLGVRKLAHGSAQQPTAFAAELNEALALPNASFVTHVAVNAASVFITALSPEATSAELWSVPKTGDTPQKLTTFNTTNISTLAADASGAFVGSSNEDKEPGVWYVPNVAGAGKQPVYDEPVGDFAVGGEDLIALNNTFSERRLVALARSGGAAVDLTTPDSNNRSVRALGADASGLYYLANLMSSYRVSLMRVRREPGASALGSPVELLSDVPAPALELPLALDASWVYFVTSDGTALYHVAK